MNTNESLVNHLINKEVISSNRVISAMNSINRFDYCNCSVLTDTPNTLNTKNQTISAPHIHGKALEILLPKLIPGNTVLDVGCGSGYITACFCHLLDVNNNFKSNVIGIDIHQELVNLSINNIKKNHLNFLPRNKPYNGTNKFNNVKILKRNGWNGYTFSNTKKEIYDAIHVGAGATEIPKQLFNQLKRGGIMIIPVNGIYKTVFKTSDAKIIVRNGLRVRFVPLVKSIKNNYNNKKRVKSNKRLKSSRKVKK